METAKSINRRQFLKLSALGAGAAALAACAPGAAPAAKENAGKLEIFSWWTSGGEVEARAVTFLALGFDSSSMTPQNALHGGQPDPAAGEFHSVVQTLESSEELTHICHVEAHAERRRPRDVARREPKPDGGIDRGERRA